MLFDEELNVAGQRCPLPVLKARKRLKALAPGAILRVFADDPLAAIDIPALCTEDGHELVGQRAQDKGWQFFIRKG
ncbi:sulfurtransferase TusA family protein [Acuticoccus sp. MNP-M23]|uniref:sulfurtransferase TusA family protein n=1 Tax=Acuticoccus sp. MNP-M23 TaxID=3072793 RepID=UPI0028150F88|nr:sulfurtransferase TusA family protein [Acuticoccus sp. MNP-M23]WMS45070.1 sulfurtransferase TusA family protein [Acuticoccus sp. MNP-M23]